MNSGNSAERTRGRSPVAWKIVVAVVSVVVVMLVGVGITNLIPNLNPFGTKEVDRSGPVLLEAVRDLSQYHAAVGEFQVVVDLEKDVKWVPAFLAGTRALFVAAGSVNAFVDFSGLKGDALKVSADGKSVDVRLPEPQLDKPNLDQKRSYLYAEQRGVFDRLKSLFEVPDQQQFYLVGEQKIADAAKGAGLIQRARDNTRAMLIGMLQPLGFQVSFSAENPAG
jgi:hypothetical protein